ncbi:MAG: purine-nucleoside phosphorylase [Spirochaetia bacterium]|jgi:purine-nucleoside phosphorylase|uniref:Uridine phosphorylase n=1 Tax=uncultured spirochete TaxID=156406 RepID=A0A3P3XF88_9SPIR|nr:purine-nucleoside phosphorylase [Rectinema subterraneum]MDQ7795649.1 purine-nucleoside phosphorylase [Spirochaetia bacterium]SLM09918.1 Purine nucleoside phosphorylase DeoD-type [uncultured spirochete]
MHEKEIHEKNLANYRNGTPHNAAKAGEIAPVVLMPGDPLRAKRIAETMLSDVHQFNAIRNMFGYTGMYQGKRISVMGSGMGAPSMGIYSYELYSFYEVQAIIRIGTCGGLAPDVEVGDLVIAMSASTDSNYAHQYELNGTFSPCCSYELLEPAVQLARARNMRFHVGNVFSSDVFSLYSALPPERGWQKWGRMGCKATDMECYALYCNAAWTNKQALTLLTCSDSNITHKEMTPEARQNSLDAMIQIALDIA